MFKTSSILRMGSIPVLWLRLRPKLLSWAWQAKLLWMSEILIQGPT